MPRITISYRRDDSLAITGRIFDRLAEHYGRDALFRDLEGIPSGADFREAINASLLKTDILVTIVGPRWIGPRRRSRLIDPADPVRIEIETAIRNGKLLLPVLVLGAQMPQPAQLPQAIQDFAYRNAVRVDTGTDFDPHMARLIRVIDTLLGYDETLPASPTDDTATSPSVEQRPAAYRFMLREDKIDVLPERPEAEDREFAIDTYQELLGKAQELLKRLQNSNSAHRACDSFSRLLAALGSSFDDLRPGVLLSRVRSIEADRAAFDTEEARGELFADAFSVIDDTLQTARDLMAAFPAIRRIEAERLALDLDRHSDAVPILRERLDEIKSAAGQSSAATEQAINALSANDAQIEDATDPVLRTSLVADTLLVARNFLGAMAGALGKATSELGEVGGETWAALKAELPKGVGFAARVAPFMGLVSLVGWVAGPVAGVAAVVPAFKGLASAFKKFAAPETPVIPKLEPKSRPTTKTRKKVAGASEMRRQRAD